MVVSTFVRNKENKIFYIVIKALLVFVKLVFVTLPM